MPDTFTEVTGQSWLGRLGESIKGVIFGLVLFVVAFPLLWWNEGRAVKTAKGLKELSGTVVSVQTGAVDPAHDGKPVHATAEVTADETVRDPQLGVEADAIRLRRTVEMFQWEEHEKRETRKKLGGGRKTVTTYSYDKGWSEEVIDSGRFKKPGGHENPGRMPISSEDFRAETVHFGAFTLSPGLVEQLDNFEEVPVTEEDLRAASADVPGELSVHDGTFYMGADPADPRIGDLRISFAAAGPTTASVIARQTGSTFEAWQSATGISVQRLEVGSQTAEQMVDVMEHENTMLTWGLRLGGFLLMTVGLALVFNPIAVVADVVPLFGDILRTGFVLAAAVVAASLSLVTIALAWLAYRPVLGILLVGVALALVVLVKLRGKSKKNQEMPPLPPVPG